MFEYFFKIWIFLKRPNNGLYRAYFVEIWTYFDLLIFKKNIFQKMYTFSPL